MNFYSVRDFRTESKSIWDTLSSGDEVIITNNGKPSAIMTGIPEGSFDEMVQAVRQAKASLAFTSMRRHAQAQGFMTDDEIEAEIQSYRKETSV